MKTRRWINLLVALGVLVLVGCSSSADEPLTYEEPPPGLLDYHAPVLPEQATLPIELVADSGETIDDLRYGDQVYIDAEALRLDLDRKVFVCSSAKINRTDGDLLFGYWSDGITLFIPEGAEFTWTPGENLDTCSGDLLPISTVRHG